MADTKISALTAAATPLAGTEVLPIVQSGSTVKVSVANLTAGRAVATAGGSFTDNITQSTAAKGINFTANTAAAGMTSQLLNWYEEGTWTPTFVPASGSFTSITYAYTGGYYTRIGRYVCVTGRLRTSAITVGTASGALSIGGLPFTAISTTDAAQGGDLIVADPGGWNTNNPSFGFVNNGATTVALQYKTTANGAASDSNVTDLTTGSLGNNISFTLCYFCQ